LCSQAFLFFRLSQGSVAAFIRWGRWSYTSTCIVHR